MFQPLGYSSYSIPEIEIAKLPPDAIKFVFANEIPSEDGRLHFGFPGVMLEASWPGRVRFATFDNFCTLGLP